jgi:hypothetical protein
MLGKNQESAGMGHGQASTAGVTVGSLADGDALIGLAKFEITDLKRRQARWAQARGLHSIRSISSWGPGVVGAVIYFAGTWIANAYVDRSNTATLYLAYIVSALTGIVFTLGWTIKTLIRRLDAVMEIIEQQK